MERVQPVLTAVQVALHPEGVDRNLDMIAENMYRYVALHPEGVDRNRMHFVVARLTQGRPPPGGRG